MTGDIDINDTPKHDAKIKSIQEFAQPRSVKLKRRFLGTTFWYRRFIQKYAQAAALQRHIEEGGNF